MEVGDSPSNVVGGLVAGSVAIHVMLRFAGPAIAALAGHESLYTCPPIMFALACLLFCPLPNNGRAFALKFYGYIANHVLTLLGSMIGSQAIHSPKSVSLDNM